MQKWCHSSLLAPELLALRRKKPGPCLLFAWGVLQGVGSFKGSVGGGSFKGSFTRSNGGSLIGSFEGSCKRCLGFRIPSFGVSAKARNPILLVQEGPSSCRGLHRELVRRLRVEERFKFGVHAGVVV